MAERVERRAYRVADVARQLSLSERATWRLIRTGELSSFLIGRSRRVSSDAIDAFIASKSGQVEWPFKLLSGG
jgi:excisionase family DNA binding protein